MKSALFIDLAVESPLTYENEFIHALKQDIPGIETLDLDAGSELLLFSYAATMVKDSERSALVIKAFENSPTKSIYRLADILVKNQNNVLVLLEGNNPILEKMLSVLKDHFLRNKAIPDFLPLAKAFLKNER